MKILTWNIQHGGGTRLARIVEEVSAYDADVIALTEFRDGQGTTLRAALLERGWPYIETTHPTGNVNGIAAFSRTPMRRTRPCPAPPEGFDRWLDIDFPDYGFGVGVLHIMAAGSGKKHPTNVAKSHFWDAVLQAAEARLRDQCTKSFHTTTPKNNRNADYGTDDARSIQCVLFPHA